MSYLVVNRKPNESLTLTVKNADGSTTQIEVDMLSHRRVGIRAADNVEVVRSELVRSPHFG